MSFNSIFESILNPIFSPLLKIPYLLSIILISFVISLIIVVIYKYFTNQSLMKDLKDEIKDLQKQMKDLRDKPQDMMKIQKRAMDANFKYMIHSLKPTLITFIPIIIIFGWLNMHMAYYPLVQDQEFSVLLDFNDQAHGAVQMADVQDLVILNGNNQTISEHQAKFLMKGKPGEYTISFKYDEEEYEKDIIITESTEQMIYKNPVQVYRKQYLKRITVSNKKILAFEGIPIMQDIPWIGGFGWLGSYILFSLIFSLGLRKLLKVY